MVLRLAAMDFAAVVRFIATLTDRAGFTPHAAAAGADTTAVLRSTVVAAVMTAVMRGRRAAVLLGLRAALRLGRAHRLALRRAIALVADIAATISTAAMVGEQAAAAATAMVLRKETTAGTATGAHLGSVMATEQAAATTMPCFSCRGMAAEHSYAHEHRKTCDTAQNRTTHGYLEHCREPRGNPPRNQPLHAAQLSD